MPFGSISDDLAHHRKVCHLLSLEGGQAALGLWLLANSWCNRELTDGFVPSYMIARLGDWKLEHADALVTVELWHAGVGGYQFHDWEDFNDTREQVLRRRAADAAKKGNQRSTARAVRALSRLVSRQESPGDTQEDGGEESPGDADDDRSGYPAPPSPSPSPSPPLASLGGVRASTGTHACLDAAEARVAECVTLVRVRFAERYHQTRGMTWASAGAPGVEQLGRWLAQNTSPARAGAPDPEAAVARILDGFFGDKWAQENDYPIGTLAKQAGRWLKPPTVKRNVTKGVADPSPASEFKGTNLDALFGPRPAGGIK